MLFAAETPALPGNKYQYIYVFQMCCLSEIVDKSWNRVLDSNSGEIDLIAGQVRDADTAEVMF